MRARRTGGDDRVVGAFETMGDRDIAAGQIDQPARDEERRNPPRPLVAKGDRGVVDAAENVTRPLVVCKDIPGRASFLHFLQLCHLAVDFVTTNV